MQKQIEASNSRKQVDIRQGTRYAKEVALAAAKEAYEIRKAQDLIAMSQLAEKQTSQSCEKKKMTVKNEVIKTQQSSEKLQKVTKSIEMKSGLRKPTPNPVQKQKLTEPQVVEIDETPYKIA